MKQFDKLLSITKKVMKNYFSDSKLEELAAKMRKEYEILIPQLPYIGGAKNPFTSMFIQSISILAIMRILEKEGMEFREIGKFIYDYYETLNKRRTIPADNFFSESYINGLKQFAKYSQLRQYPGDWVMKFVEGDGKTFDYGFDITECGDCKFFKQQGNENLMPLICISDYASARAAGYGLKRTQTLGNGAPICDFRYLREGSTPRGWPPDDLQEFNKNF